MHGNENRKTTASSKTEQKIESNEPEEQEEEKKHFYICSNYYNFNIMKLRDITVQVMCVYVKHLVGVAWSSLIASYHIPTDKWRHRDLEFSSFVYQNVIDVDWMPGWLVLSLSLFVHVPCANKAHILLFDGFVAFCFIFETCFVCIHTHTHPICWQWILRQQRKQRWQQRWEENNMFADIKFYIKHHHQQQGTHPQWFPPT